MGKLNTTIDSQSLTYLKDQGYMEIYSQGDYDALKAEIAQQDQISTQMANMKKEFLEHEQVLKEEEGKEHSIRFYLEKKEKRDALKSLVEKEESVVENIDKTEKSYEVQFNNILTKKALMSNLIPYNNQFIMLTDKGKNLVKDLAIRIYRFSDEDFTNYEKEMTKTMEDLDNIVNTSKTYYSYIESVVPNIEQDSILLSTAIALAKFKDNVDSIKNRFTGIYEALGSYSKNIENHLMATEILTGAGKDIEDNMEDFKEVFKKVMRESSVPRESATAVAAIIYLSRRYDGTFPLQNLDEFRKITPSYEAAAVMASINKNFNEISEKFADMRKILSQWGYDESEDVELSSAYVAISELKPDEIKDKLSIVIDALKNYLEYPLVASTIVATVPVMESNETLDLLSKAYHLLENNFTGFERSELMAASASLIHGIRSELITGIDSKAPLTDTPYNFYYVPSSPLFQYYVPVLMVHGCYYSTFSGIGGVHPAHIHAVGGFSG